MDSEEEAEVIGISEVEDAALSWMTEKAIAREVARRIDGGIEIRGTSASASVSQTGGMTGERIFGKRRESYLTGWKESATPNAGKGNKE